MSPSRPVLSLDPGASGGMAFIQEGENHVPFLRKLPADIAAIPKEIQAALMAIGDPLPMRVLAIVEQVGGFIQRNPLPGSAMFKFGASYGAIIGTLATLQIEVVQFRPMTWQRILGMVGAGSSPREHKRMLRTLALRLFPEVKGITNRTCDALLMLEAGKLSRLF